MHSRHPLTKRTAKPAPAKANTLATLQKPHAVITETERTALKYTEYTWNDIMLAMNEIGYRPNEDEKARICHRIFNKKLEYLARRKT